MMPQGNREMTEIAYLRARAAELRVIAQTARDPVVVGALQDVAAEFDHEADVVAVDQANHGAYALFVMVS